MERLHINMGNWQNLYKDIIKRKLCCMCGTCVGICPTNTISICNEKFIFESDKCISCSRCVDSCPGKSFDYKKYNQTLFNKKTDEISPILGSYISIYKGYSTDISIRGFGSSGGMASAVACYLLKQGIVDGVIGIITEKDDNTSFKPAILRTAEEVCLAFGSKYTLVPTNKIINKILSTPGKYLYIGLPCQIQGLQKAIEHTPHLRERIFMTISIFCGFNMERKATEFLIGKSKILNIKTLQYRGIKNAETGFLITGHKGEEFFIDKHGYTLLNMFFSPERCWKCYDLTGEFADLSLGDAWELKQGSRIIIRTEKAKDIILDMQDRGLIFIEDSSEEDIFQTQSKLITYKKKDIAQRAKKLKSFPDYGIAFKAQLSKERVKAELFLFCLKFCSSKFARGVLRLLPIRFTTAVSRVLRKDKKAKTDNFREVLRYGFWGVVTVLFSYLSYASLVMIGVEYRLSNLISLISTKIFAYLTNKHFVFKSKSDNVNKLLIELVRYVWTRGIVGVIDYFGLILFVEAFGINKMIGKGTMLFVTTVLNYFFGKKHVFKKDKVQGEIS